VADGGGAEDWELTSFSLSDEKIRSRFEACHPPLT
jgi:hypothetical protein